MRCRIPRFDPLAGRPLHLNQHNKAENLLDTLSTARSPSICVLLIDWKRDHPPTQNETLLSPFSPLPSTSRYRTYVLMCGASLSRLTAGFPSHLRSSGRSSALGLLDLYLAMSGLWYLPPYMFSVLQQIDLGGHGRRRARQSGIRFTRLAWRKQQGHAVIPWEGIATSRVITNADGHNQMCMSNRKL